MKKLKIILLDDIDTNRESVISAIKSALTSEIDAIEFDPNVVNDMTGTHESRLRNALLAPPHDGVSLIVADSDLSSYAPLSGLSESTVRRVADELGIPECGYARGERADDHDYVERAEMKEACIRLCWMDSHSKFAADVIDIAQGFRQISDRLSSFTRPGANKGASARALAEILQKPEYVDKIALYASGDQNRLAALSWRQHDRQDAELQHRRRVCMLGYWLWDSVLRFPGVVLNSVAAASYLNIAPGAFESVESLFSSARYMGPFSKAKPKLWWRAMLDDLLADSECADGRDHVRKVSGANVDECVCSEDSVAPAGYYCVFSHKPVSLRNSVGGLAWLPRGADLARVSKQQMAEIGPWL